MQGAIDYDKFRVSVERLHEAARELPGPHPDLPVLTREASAESVIRRFNACYDCLLKVLRRYLVVVLGVIDLPNSLKPALRLAHQNHLLLMPLEQRLLYANCRTATSHD